MRIFCEVHLRKDRNISFKIIIFFPDLFREQIFTLIPLTKGKHATVEKTRFYKSLILFSVGFLSPVSALLSKLDVAIFVIKVRTIFGADGGWTRLQVCAGAGSTSELS